MQAPFEPADCVPVINRVLQIVFYNVFTGISDYFDSEKLKVWMFFVKRVLDMNIPEEHRRPPTRWSEVLQAEHFPTWKAKVKALKVVNKFLFHVRMIGKQQIDTPARQQFLESLQNEFYSQYMEGFFEACMMLCKMHAQMLIVPNLLDQALRNIFSCLQEPKVVKALGWRKLWTIVTEVCLPAMESNLKDQEMWQQDPAGYISTRDSRVDLHNLVKFGAKDLLLYLTGLTPRELGLNIPGDINLIGLLLMNYIYTTTKGQHPAQLKPDFTPEQLMNQHWCIQAFGDDGGRSSYQPSEEVLIECLLLMKDKGDISNPLVLHNYRAAVLSNFLLGFRFDPQHQQSVAAAQYKFHLNRLLEKCISFIVESVIQHKGPFKAVSLTYLLDNDRLSSRTQSEFLENLGKFFEINITSNHLALQSSSLVVMTRYISYCILAKQAFRPAVSPLLRIAVPLLQKIDHKNVVEAINILVKEYPEDIIPNSFDLLCHIALSFQGYLIHSKNKPNDSRSELDDSSVSGESVSDDQFESFRAASACIDTIHRLLFLKGKPLFQPECHERSEQIVLDIFVSALLQEDKDMFQSCLLVLPALLQKLNPQTIGNLSPALKFFFPIICYILGEVGTAGLVKQSDIQILPALSALASQLPDKYQEVLREVNYSGLSEGAVSAAFICLSLFSRILGIDGMAREREYYVYPGSDEPRSFLELLYQTTKHLISCSLTSTCDLDIVMSLRVFAQAINTLHPNGKIGGWNPESNSNQFNPLVIDMIDFGLNLAKEGGNRNKHLRTEILCLICSCISVRPEVSWAHLHKQSHLESFTEALSSLTAVESSQREFLLPALSSTLSLLVVSPQAAGVAGDTRVLLEALLPACPSLLLCALSLATTHTQAHVEKISALHKRNAGTARELRITGEEVEIIEPDRDAVSSLDSSEELASGEDGDDDDAVSEAGEPAGGVELVDDGDLGVEDGEYEMLGKEIRRMDRSLEKKKRLLGIEFFTAGERMCQLTVLKGVLEQMEKNRPEVAKELVQKVGISRVQEFLNAVPVSQDYHKYLEDKRLNYL